MLAASSVAAVEICGPLSAASWCRPRQSAGWSGSIGCAGPWRPSCLARCRSRRRAESIARA
eukprot:2788873-Pyramimonas_sp.AAC.1